MKTKIKEIIKLIFIKPRVLYLLSYGIFAFVLFIFIIYPKTASAAKNCSPDTMDCVCGDYLVAGSGPATYTLQSDLICPGAVALYIGSPGSSGDNKANRITMDCNGYKIAGSSIQNQTSYNRDNFEIKNCRFYGVGLIINRTSGSLNNITINHNVFDNISGSAIDGRFGGSGVKNILSNNDVLDSSGGDAVYVTGLSTGSEIKNNRIIVRPSSSFSGYRALYVISSTVNIFNNYLDCHKVTNSISSDYCYADLELSSVSGRVMDNVFAGRGVVVGGGSVSWCDATNNRKNIFRDKGKLSDGINDWVQKPADCSSVCGGNCAKPCLTTFPTIPYILGAGSANENICLDKNTLFDFSSLTPSTTAITIQNTATTTLTVLCNETFGGATGKIKGDLTKHSTGIKIDQNTTAAPVIVGCLLEDFQTSFEIASSSNVFMRENLARAANSADDDKIYNYYSINYPFGSYQYQDWRTDAGRILFYKNPSYNLLYNRWVNLDGTAVEKAYWESNLNYLTSQGIKKKVIYLYDPYISDTNYGAYKEINGALALTTFSNIGHLTVVNSATSTSVHNIHDITIDHGDGLFLAYLGATLTSKLSIYNNTLTNNLRGLVAGDINYVNIYNNTVNYNRKYGGYFTNSRYYTLGHETDDALGNRFNYNGEAGLYIQGQYVLPIPLSGIGTTTKNTIANNGYWGLVVSNVATNKFLNNEINNNGTKDDQNCTSCSPGWYVNQSAYNLFQGNEVKDNSGDNLYFDSSARQDDEGRCSVISVPSSMNNIFVDNSFLNSQKRSGVYITNVSTCIADSVNPANPGGIGKNYFGYFYLPKSRSGYNTSALQIESGFPYYKLSSFTAPPAAGNNKINNNFLDGVTIVLSELASYGYQRYYDDYTNVVVENDFYSNEIKRNSRYGIYFKGINFCNLFFGATNYSACFEYNDIVKNSISGNQYGGIKAENAFYSRIFGNTFTDNFGAGVRVSGASDNERYNEIGNDGYFDKDNDGIKDAGEDEYKNSIAKGGGQGHGVGIGLYDNNFTVADSNEIDGFINFGIVASTTQNIVLKRNKIKNSLGQDSSVGLAIMNSVNASSSANEISEIDSANYRGRYLYVGPTRGFGAAYVNNFYPYPDVDIKYFYNHSIDTTNQAGPAGSLKPVYYLYGTSCGTWDATKSTYHFQVVNSPNCSFTNAMALDKADPAEIGFYKNTASVQPFKFTLTNCRGECLLLYNIGFNPASLNPINFTNITISGARESGIKGFYVKNTVFDTVDVENNDINLNDIPENGGLYLYNSENNEVRTSRFRYLSAFDALTNKKWDMFFAGKAQNNTIYPDNYFGFSAAQKSSGVYEKRSGLDTKEYSSATLAEMASDSVCRIDNSDNKCDPNCTSEQLADDDDCASAACTKVANDCCLAILDGDIDPDCPAGADPDSSGSAVLGDDDGICVSGSTCDPNCTSVASHACMVCDNSAGNCCDPSIDGTCDYDCPRGADPDCVAEKNIWCNVGNGAGNSYTLSSAPNLNLPNYYIPQPPTTGGGGVPNDAYLCYMPKMQFDSTWHGSGIEQGARGGYRGLALGGGQNQRGRYKYLYTAMLEFADMRGQDLFAKIVYNPQDKIDWKDGWQGTSNFLNPTSTCPRCSPANPIPGVAASGEFRLGTAAAPIKTYNITWYPANATLWDNHTPPTYPYHNRIQVTWDSFLSLSTLFGTTGNYYARIFANNTHNTGSTTANFVSWPNADKNKQFSYDFQAPQVIWTGNVTTTPFYFVGAPYCVSWNPLPPFNCTGWATPEYYNWKVSWNAPVTEPNWGTSGHYEIWYGSSSSDVQSRSGAARVFDDLTLAERAGTSLPYGSGSSDYASCTNDGCLSSSFGYDTKLKSITCAPGNYCQSVIGSSSFLPRVVVGKRGEYGPVVDTYLNQGFPDYNYGVSQFLSAVWSPGGGVGDPWIRPGNSNAALLDFGQVCNSDEYLTKAELTLYFTDANGSANHHDVWMVWYQHSSLFGNTWREGTGNGADTGDGATWKIYDPLYPVGFINNWFRQGASKYGGGSYMTDDIAIKLATLDDGAMGFATTTLSVSVLDYLQQNSMIATKLWIGPYDGNEVDKITFASSEDPNVSHRPKLTLTCTPKPVGYFNVCAVDNLGNESCSGVIGASGANQTTPCVETKYGDIYSGSDIIAPQAIEGKFNATFRILTSGAIADWTSEEKTVIEGGTKQHVEKGFGALGLPKKTNEYTVQPLGSLDFLNHTSFCCGANSTISDLKNRYGAFRVQEITSDTINSSWSPSKLLDGNIYYSDGNIAVNSSNPIKFLTGTGNQDGSGLIIINGDLTINAKIEYDSGSPGKIANLASAVWIVLGDVRIDKDVSIVSGTFIVLGKQGVEESCPSAQCGQFSTGTKAPALDKKLTVQGPILARQFNFERNYSSATECSELIIYNGRLQANPPLGIEDFAKNLPVWK